MVVRAPVITEEPIKFDNFARLSVLCPNGMTALHSNLSAEVGPDHYFHVVPAASEYPSLTAKGGHVACHGPADVRVASVGLLLWCRSPYVLSRHHHAASRLERDTPFPPLVTS